MNSIKYDTVVGLPTAQMSERHKFVDPPLRSNHIAIIGFGPNTKAPEAVWADKNIEKWTLNHGHTIDPRWDRLFEFHDHATVKLESHIHTRGVNQQQILQDETTRPIYMREHEWTVPCSIRFPIERWKKFYGKYCDKLDAKPYCVMAIGFMIGEAIIRLVGQQTPEQFGGGRISLYGIELIDDEEWNYQRACCEFFAGYAQGRGIYMHVPMASAVLASTGLYEYDNGEKTAVLNWLSTHLHKRWEQAREQFMKAKTENDDAVARMQSFSARMQEIEDEKKIIGHLLRGGDYS